MQRTRCAPSPLVGEGWGGGWLRETEFVSHITPTPNPSPQGGGEQTEFAARLRLYIMSAKSTADVTEDAVLGGRLRLRQPKRGHRVGHDAILLAAACPARAGDTVVDLGAGVGAAGLALAARVPGTTVTLVEIDPKLAALAAENAKLNQLETRVRAVALDVTAPARAFAAAGLAADSVAHVLMNPPFNDPQRQRTSPDAGRALAHAAPRAVLARLGSRPRRGCCARAAR